MLCDFHVHSHHSDGEHSPSRVVDMVADTGVTLLSLTDHDTTDGLSEARERARARGITFVGGIEMTAYAHDQVVHVLGLGIREGTDALDQANRVAMHVWADNQRRWVGALVREGHRLSEDDLLADAPLRLPVLIERLIEHGVDDGDARRCYERFKIFFASLGAGAYDRLASPAGAADAIRAAGGVAILAHPARLRAGGLAERLLADLDGIEARYALYDERQCDELLALANRSGKLYSCGSDYHGYFNGEYENPRYEAPSDLLERLGIKHGRGDRP